MRLRAALVTPLSGPLAGYGEAGAVGLRLWAESCGARLSRYDAHPDPVAALRLAEAGRPDLLFGPYGSGPARAVAAATRRLMWNHGGAQVPSAPHVVPLLAPASTYWVGAVQAVAQFDPAVRRVLVLHGESGFGRAVGGGAVTAAAELGLATSVLPLLLPSGDPAGDPAVADGPPVCDPLPAADLLLVAGSFAEERAAAARLLPGRWRAAGFVGAGVEEVLAGLGAAREGLLGPAQWLASVAPAPDEGPPAAEFVAAYRRATGSDPPYPAAQAFAAGLIAARCVRDAGTAADEAVRLATLALDCTTMFDRFQLDPATGDQIGHRVLTVQWQDGRRRVIWPPDRAETQLRGLRCPRPAPGPGG